MIFKKIVESGLTYFTDEMPDWMQAIHIACKTLEEKHIIDIEYANQVIECVKKYGPYIVVVDGLAIPHCNEGNQCAHDTALSFTRFEKPIVFDYDKEDVRSANVFITLASVNHDEHMKNIQALFTVLDNEIIFNKLMDCKSNEDLLKLDEFVEEQNIQII